MASIKDYFKQEQAAAYDKRFEKISALKDVLHLTTQMILQELPDRARILVVGAGTGAEILHLARCYPGWEFTAVEPSIDMLEICRQKVMSAGLADQCRLHHGYVHQLPRQELYDAATSLLVSQFLTDLSERQEFFKAIHDRLRPGALLVSADLGHCGEEHDRVWEIWLRAIAHTGASPEQMAEYCKSMDRGVSLLPDSEMRALLSRAGFEAPTHVLRTILINGWFARRS